MLRECAVLGPVRMKDHDGQVIYILPEMCYPGTRENLVKC